MPAEEPTAASAVSPMFLPADSQPDLRDQLALGLRRYLSSTSRLEWGPFQANALFAQWARGWLTGSLWRPSQREASGLALAQQRPAGARVHGLWLDPPGGASLRAFLRDFDASSFGPVQVLTDVLADVSDEEQGAILRPSGFWHREKVRLRRPADRRLPTPRRESRIRPMRVDDIDAVAALYARAYRERPGEFWVSEAAEPEADARENVGTFLDPSGGWASTVLPQGSWVWDEDGRVVGAVVMETVGKDAAAYVDDLIVDPDRHRQGIGRMLLERALAELTRAGTRPVELAAYRFGAPYRLYRSLGFDEVPPPEGRLDGQWVRGADPLPAEVVPPPS